MARWGVRFLGTRPIAGLIDGALAALAMTGMLLRYRRERHAIAGAARVKGEIVGGSPASHD